MGKHRICMIHDYFRIIVKNEEGVFVEKESIVDENESIEFEKNEESVFEENENREVILKFYTPQSLTTNKR
ncbi:28582_t:CDS:2, partial [Gigaspora margarita]